MTLSSSFENLCVVLVAARNPLNIGSVARAMSNFGALHLRVVVPYAPAFREARSAVGASAVLTAAKECKDIPEAVADCSLVVGTTAIGNRQPIQPIRDLGAAALMIRKALPASRVALLFGSEKWGLSNEALSHCHWLLHIPTRKEHQSMNLSHAVAVCLYELARSPLPRFRPARKESADMATMNRIHAALLEALRESGYINPRVSAAAPEKLRRLIRRMQLQPDDAQVFLGMLSKILWKLRSA